MNVNNSTQGYEKWTRTQPIPVDITITLFSILLVLSLLGNVLVIAVVYCNQNLRTNMNYLIVNMAVSDLLVPLVAMPWGMSFYMLRPGEWLVDGPLGDALCKLVPFLSHISPYVSSISLVIIALQRFFAVVYPTRRQFLSCKTRWIAISFPWIVAMALFSPTFYANRLTNDTEYTICDDSWSQAFDHLTAKTIFISIVTAVGFVIPLIIIIILYTIIVYKLRKSLNNVMDMIEQETIRSRQRRNRRIFSMLITIVVMFTVCWCPFIIFNLLYHIKPSMLPIYNYKNSVKINFAFRYAWFFQAAINPCIYFVFLKDMRKGLISLWCRNPRTASTNRCTRTPGRYSNQDPTCTPLHINTTSV